MKVTINITSHLKEVNSIIYLMRDEHSRYYAHQDTPFGYSQEDGVHTWRTSAGAMFIVNVVENTATFIGRRHALRGRWFKDLQECPVISYETNTPYLKWHETNDELSKKLDTFIECSMNVYGNIDNQLQGAFGDYPSEVVKKLFYIRLAIIAHTTGEKLKNINSLLVQAPLITLKKK